MNEDSRQHDESARTGADPLDGNNPLRTGNFNKIVLYVFVILLAGMLAGIAVIKFGHGTPHQTSGAPSSTSGSPQ